MAHAFGGRVYQNMVDGKPYKETGFSQLRLTDSGRSCSLFSGFPESFPVFQWHGDVFELPRDADLLATGDRVGHQAFKHGNSNYGLLFHLEVTPKTVEELVTIDREWLYRDNEPDERAVLEESYSKQMVLRQLAEKLFSNWLEL